MTFFIDGDAFLNIFFQAAIDESECTVRRTRGYRFLKNNTNKDRIKLYYLLSPPGAGSIIASRYLFEAGEFDGWLIEPGAQFQNERKRYKTTLGVYKNASKVLWKQSKPYTLGYPQRPLRLLVTEKPQHMSPGAEMQFMNACSLRSVVLIRDPQICAIKMLRLCALIFSFETQHLQTVDEFIAQGLIENNHRLIEKVGLDSRDITVADKIKDYMFESNDY